MTNSKRLDGKKKLVPLTKRMEADLRSYCRDKGIDSESELVRRAIARYIYADYGDETLKLQALDQVKARLDRLRDMVEVLFRYVGLTHVSTLAYHPEIDPSLADAAFASANARHEKVNAALREGLKNDPPFLERLLHEFYSEGDGGQG